MQRSRGRCVQVVISPNQRSTRFNHDDEVGIKMYNQSAGGFGPPPIRTRRYELTRFLAASRYLLVIPVIGCVILTAAVCVMGVGRIFTGGEQILRAGEFSPKAAKAVALAAVEIIDLFLVATVAYIVAVGLYKLFIVDRELDLPMARKITNLKDLEDKIIGVIVAALAVAFLGQAAEAGEVPENMLGYGGGIALVIVALTYFMRNAGNGSDPDNDK